MTRRPAKGTRGGSQDTSKGIDNTNNQNDQNQKQDRQYKNIETSVNNPNYFNDDYEVKQEDEMNKEEARSERDNRPDRRKQK
jgi:hypothetical protein